MSIIFGPISRRGHGPKKISNKLPEGVTLKNGKYYRDGKELKFREVSWEEFMDENQEKKEKK